MKKLLAIIGICACAGCQTITVDPVQSWEGHFYTTNEVHQAIQKLELKKGQSVWILSDSTLSRVLKNVK